jgi:hypothetical protein
MVCEPLAHTWTPPALQGRVRFWDQDRTASTYIRPLVHRSVRALMTFARRILITNSASSAPVPIRFNLRRSDLLGVRLGL